MKPLFTALFCATTMFSQVFAQTATPAKKTIAPATNYATLLVAYAQQHIPNDTTQPVVDIHKFVLTWVSGKATPESFFWRSLDGWKICKVSKVIPIAKKSDYDDKWYKLAAINVDDIKPGDLIEVAPLDGGKYRMPAEIPESVHYTLYMRTVTSPWMSLSVPTKIIRRLPDVPLL
ncbi:MAG: hypothetical protein EOP51_19500 [Sphingobacteriales bacterium]|nr:MAG: hypothetical protein EOP51_19500 [Sphingobacteriales bacterium]